MRAQFPIVSSRPSFASFRSLQPLVLSLAALLAAGCGSGSGTGSAFSGNTKVVLLASSTANDQLSSFTVNIKSLTLVNKSGATINVLASPVTEEFIHLNGRVEPIATVNIPQGDYVSASSTIEGSNPICNAQASGSLLIDGLTGAPSGAINLPQPITVMGEAMGLVLNLRVDKYPEACPTPSGYVIASPVTASFNLLPMAIGARPTNSSNGLAEGMEGTIVSVGPGGSGMSVDGLVSSQTPPNWEVSFNSATVFQGASGPSQLARGVPVDFDVTLQPDGSMLATRVGVVSNDTSNLTVASGPLMTVSAAEPVAFVIGTAQQGYLPLAIGGFGYANFGNAQFQTSGQFGNLASLPFRATFDSSDVVPGQNTTVTTQATSIAGGPAYIPLTTMTLRPQTINGTVSGISTSGNFTTFTVALASYDLFPQFAVQPGQTTLLTDPNIVVVYVDNQTQMLNSNTIGVGGLFRFYGLIFNDSGTLRMDCSQISDGVKE